MPDQNSNKVLLRGSHREAVEGANLKKADPDEVFQVTLELRRKAEPPATSDVPWDIDEYMAAYGASEADAATVVRFADAYHLEVVESDLGQRTVRLSGRLADFEKAFGIELASAELDGNQFRHRSGEIYLPPELDGAVVAVVGLDSRPLLSPHLRANVATASQSLALRPQDVAALYKFPAGDGAGATISILEFGGGFLEDDMTAYFTGQGMTVPAITVFTGKNASNSPGQNLMFDKEVTMDIQIAGAIAPSARYSIYFAQNNEQGFLWAIQHSVSTSPSPTVISVSWGVTESKWDEQSRSSFDRYLQDAAHLGIPVAVATGDLGSADGTAGLAVQFPASSPNALACGGTRLETSGGAITSETVWNNNGATGGGFSTAFQIPPYQHGVAAIDGTGRGTPDVAGNADPDTGYKIFLGGNSTVVGGTSAVAPLWAALIARAAGPRKAGFLNSKLYANAGAFTDITQGNNSSAASGGKYVAGVGWDACTGLGSPIGEAIATLISTGS